MVLELEQVTKRIGTREIVRSISISVREGEVYGFLGPNGAGKTTTIRMIVGLVRPTAGRVVILGSDVQRDRARALAYVGAIVENPEMYSYLTGRQNLVHYARLAGIDVQTKRIDELAQLVGLTDRLDDKVKRYSLGMRQRLGVAQALLGRPRLLVLDEPTNGLDPAGMREFRELIRRLAAEGMSVFVSSHLLSEIQVMCDRVAILDGGQIIAERQVAELVRGAEERMVLEVDDVDAAMAVLAAAGNVARPQTNRLEVEVAREGTPSVIRTLVGAGVGIYSVQPASESLEEAFLQLTGDGHDANQTKLQGGTNRA